MPMQRKIRGQRPSPDLITGAKALSDTLESAFLLFVGSAVSGMNIPRVPMALTVLEEILLRAAKVLQQGSYGDRLLAKYALALVSGHLRPILETTKFEEFLWQIETVAGREALDDLLERLYACHSGEFGPNQSAIAYLLKERVCLACLTTNFDNSIELAFPDLATFHHPNYPASLPSRNDPPVLLKLHGDARARNCVATMRGLSDAKRLGSHRFLQDLLAGQTMLILGYSGFGDVDISPHLKPSGAKFMWAVKGLETQVPEFVERRVVFDLSADSADKNLLLALAELCGWRKQTSGKEHEWKQALDQWCSSLDQSTLVRIVVLTLFGQVNWPVVHVSHFSSIPVLSSNRLMDEGIACLQVSAYGPAQSAFRRATSSGGLGSDELITAMTYFGFTQWRHGDLEQALNTLWWFYNESLRPHKEEEKVEIANGLRIYLEVARDWMQIRRSMKARRMFLASKRIEDVIGRLKEIPIVDIKGDILAQIVILHIRYLVGEPVQIPEVKRLYEESFRSSIWSVAEAVGRLLICLSFREGLKALVKVDHVLVRRRQWNQIRKSIAAILNAALGGWFPIILNVLDGPIFAKLATWWRDWRYTANLKLWDKQYRRGIGETV